MPFRRRSLFTLAGSAALVLMAACAHSAQFFVSPGGSDSNNGETAPTAFKTIQKAINTAAADDTILVAAGTYRESLDWENKDLILQGAGAAQTIVDPGTARGGAGAPGGRCLYVGNLTSDSSITGFTFQHGVASGDGGGIFNAGSDLTIANCIFHDNQASHWGGGIYNMELVIKNKIIGPSFPVIVNCLFTGNTALSGGGIANDDSDADITDCTFTGNTATGDPIQESGGGGILTGGSNAVITNCILWGDVDLDHNVEIDFLKGGKTALNHCDIQGGLVLLGQPTTFTTTPDANGNIGADPLFVDLANGDFRLQFGSPCIDQGDSTALPAGITTDLSGNPRISRASVDLGAYEYQNQAPTANSENFQVPQGNSLSVFLSGSDPENDAFTFAIQAGPAHGALSGTLPFLVYTPDSTYSGTDSFTYIVTDAYGAVSSVATVNIMVTPIPLATEVTGSVHIQASGFTAAGGANYTQTLTITNTSHNDIDGPLYLVLDNLGGAGVQLTNLTGTVRYIAPTGRPYIYLLSSIPVQGSIKILLKFSNPNHVTITDTPRLFTEGEGSL